VYVYDYHISRDYHLRWCFSVFKVRSVSLFRIKDPSWLFLPRFSAYSEKYLSSKSAWVPRGATLFLRKIKRKPKEDAFDLDEEIIRVLFIIAN
jgi:hypothetical protein